ncbi:MAG: MEMO1 family protein [Candidatus Aenigmatarchaeota archaeon]
MIREAKFAGFFYPKSKKEIEKVLKDFFEKVKLDKIKEEIIGIIVPHAGYIYSGLTATYAYSLLPKNIFRAVIIGPNHTGLGKEVSVFYKGKWKTPLGEVEVDENFSKKVIENSLFAKEDFEAHLEEHSIEVQVPFLQFLYKNNFKIVPICLMNQSISVAKDLANALVKTNEEFLLIASSDFTHYENYASVNEKDEKLIDAIISLDLEKFYKTINKWKISACGYGAIAVLMEITKILGGKIKLVKHSTSAEVSKDYLNVVGYASLISFKE